MRKKAPWMTAKMAARMQASTTSGKPVLVRVESDAGHGVGSTRDQALSERADVFSFFLAEMGDPEFQPTIAATSASSSSAESKK